MKKTRKTKRWWVEGLVVPLMLCAAIGTIVAMSLALTSTI